LVEGSIPSRPTKQPSGHGLEPNRFPTSGASIPVLPAWVAPRPHFVPSIDPHAAGAMHQQA